MGRALYQQGQVGIDLERDGGVGVTQILIGGPQLVIEMALRHPPAHGPATVRSQVWPPRVSSRPRSSANPAVCSCAWIGLLHRVTRPLILPQRVIVASEDSAGRPVIQLWRLDRTP